MSKTLQSSLITEPHLLDVVDDEWMQDVLANDCEQSSFCLTMMVLECLSLHSNHHMRVDDCSLADTMPIVWQLCHCRRECSRPARKATSCKRRTWSRARGQRSGRTSASSSCTKTAIPLRAQDCPESRTDGR